MPPNGIKNKDRCKFRGEWKWIHYGHAEVQVKRQQHIKMFKRPISKYACYSNKGQCAGGHRNPEI